MMSQNLLNSYEERVFEFIQVCLDPDYRCCPQVSLNEICRHVEISDLSLKQFLFSSSAVDLLIVDREFRSCLAIEFQSRYHDSSKVKERDQKKARILSLAKIPLLYARIEDVGILHLWTPNEAKVLNLFTNEGRLEAEDFVKRCCYSSV